MTIENFEYEMHLVCRAERGELGYGMPFNYRTPRRTFEGNLQQFKKEITKQGGLKGDEFINVFSKGKKIARLTSSSF